MKNYDFLIIGAGIMGLTHAYYLKKKYPAATIAILEKEAQEALHASGRNSGVLHTGIYYGQDSQKAKFCLKGNYLMKQFCQEHQLKINECGKLIVAKTANELKELKHLYDQGCLNGAKLAYVSEQEAQDIEPMAKTFEHAIWSPETASISPKDVCEKLKLFLTSQNVDFFFNCKVLGINIKKKTLDVSKKISFGFGYLINCAGVYADYIAKQFGLAENYQILPFKGLYVMIKPNSGFDLKTNIYPVPNKELPFLGIHFTITSQGHIKIGPTALPALWRENYRGLNRFNQKEFLSISRWYLSTFCRNDFNFRRLVRTECKYFLKKNLITEANKLITTNVQSNKVSALQPGIRAQLYDKKQKHLINDFLFLTDQNSCHILNAVSPAFTSSFAVANHVIEGVISV